LRPDVSSVDGEEQDQKEARPTWNGSILDAG
jgi:hypothetical protein